MFDDWGDKTQAATPRRREQFRREGRVARSADLTAAAILLTSLLVLSACGERIASAMETMVKWGLAPSLALDFASLVKASGLACLFAIMPLMLVTMIIGTGAGVVQVGFPASLQIGRRTGTRGKRGGSIALALLKFAILAWTGYALVASRLAEIFASGELRLPELLSNCWRMMLAVSLRMALILLAFGLIDYGIQRYRLERELKMTRRELQEELKQTEGDPKTRARRRKVRDSWRQALTPTLSRNTGRGRKSANS